MRAYIINLERARGRWAAMVGECERAGLEWERVAAVEGARVPGWARVFDGRGYRLRQGRRRIDGEVGCYLSHLKAVRAFMRTGEPLGLILEDDGEFAADMGAVLAALEARAVGSGWDMVRLSTVNHGRPLRVGPLVLGRHLGVFVTREKGAGAYVINRQAGARMLENLLPMRLPYDHVFDMEWWLGWRTVSVYPYPVAQRGEVSQIQTGVRAAYYPAWQRYWSVFPYRVGVETGRIVWRLWWWARLRLGKEGREHA